ncbi:Protein ATP11, mitochondrial [Cytospora mali]|uniref:Protein ATP11, mitochondrial n=1 Tax=Cytospora mali TaxID=578113 RepID=A0A194VQ67_CYTMA|nr:Protein ATP11, mitochondrial [Valsa mali]
MASIRIPALRNLLSCQSRSLRASDQRRWAQVHDVRFLATTQASRTVLEKYREKLDAKARQEGHADVEELKKAYADKINEVRTKDAAKTTPTPPPPASSAKAVSAGTPPPGPITPESAAAHAAADPSTPPSSYPSRSGVKALDQILDLPKARTLPVPELTAVWRLRHAASPHALCAVIPQHTYEAMEAQARSHPQFVLPVPHPEQGAEIHFLQWTFDPPTRTSTVLFTQLAEYKARGEFAVPHTTVTHHLDLVADKAVVLMQGQVVADKGVKPEDARWLVLCLQKFYGGWDGEKTDALGRERAEERKKLLQWFGQGDSRFSVEKLLEEAERLA